jgi:hypothetical protein
MDDGRVVSYYDAPGQLSILGSVAGGYGVNVLDCISVGRLRALPLSGFTASIVSPL